MTWLPSLRREAPLTAVHPGEASEAKAVLSSYYQALARIGIAGDPSRPWPIERAVAEGYERVIWVFKPVNRISGDASRLNWQVREGVEESDVGKVILDHPVSRLLNDAKCNPLETGKQFRKRLSAQQLLSKRGAFVEVGRSNANTPIRLDLLPPGRTEIIPGTDGVLISHVQVTRLNGSYYELPWENVLWFRDPHPIDPFSGITPLESAGLSIELDYFARLYNVAFMRNDARPGGVLAVRGSGDSDVSETEMNRIEARFGKGPVEAGKLSVIAGELSYVDLAANPRDAQYVETAKQTKEEMLAAFGMDESLFGSVAGRTFDNAEQALYNYWSQTQPDHHQVILGGFAELLAEGETNTLDTSKVEVLQRAEKAQREEARAEVAAGLRSPMSYLTLAGREDEVEDTPYTRALYISQGLTPIPATEADAETLGLGQADATEAAGAPGGEGAPGTPAIDPATGAPAITSGDQPPAPASPREAVGGTVDGGVPSAPRSPQEALEAAQAATQALGAPTQAKSLPVKARPRTPRRLRIVRPDPSTDDVASLPDDDAWVRLEAQIAAALADLAPTWVNRTVTRLESPKSRRGTRHWEPEFAVDTRIGTKALDSPKAVDEDRWRADAEAAVTPLVAAAAAAAGERLLTDLGVPDGNTRGPLHGALDMLTRTIVGMVGDSAARQARMMASIVNARDQAGDAMDAIVAAVKARGQALRAWASGLAVQAATATVSGARDTAAQTATETGDLTDVDRQWITRLDDRVRESHRRAHGQTRPLGRPFIVGDYFMRWPGDPLAPPSETAGCRCRLLYRAKATGRLMSAPAGEPVTAAQGAAQSA